MVDGVREGKPLGVVNTGANRIRDTAACQHEVLGFPVRMPIQSRRYGTRRCVPIKVVVAASDFYNRGESSFRKNGEERMARALERPPCWLLAVHTADAASQAASVPIKCFDSTNTLPIRVQDGRLGQIVFVEDGSDHDEVVGQNCFGER